MKIREAAMLQVRVGMAALTTHLNTTSDQQDNREAFALLTEIKARLDKLEFILL